MHDDNHSKRKTYQPLVASIDDSLKHVLVQEEIAHPLGNDDVNLVHWKLDLLDLSLDHGDLVFKAINSNDLPCLMNYVRAINLDTHT